MKITSRSIHIGGGTEGPRHDPYGYTEYTSEVNGRSITLHAGLMTFIRLPSGKKISANDLPNVVGNYDKRESLLVRFFEKKVGLPLRKFEDIYQRKFYFECPRMYE